MGKHGHSLAVVHVVDGFEMRRCRFKRFPFTLVYFDDGEKFVVIAVTDKRLIVQETDRKQVAKGAPVSIGTREVASAKVGGAGGCFSEAARISWAA